VVTTAEKLDNMRDYVTRVLADPSLLEPSFEARREFGPSYGYASRTEWWEAQKGFYPALFEGDDAITLPEGWLDATFTAKPIFTGVVKNEETVNIPASTPVSDNPVSASVIQITDPKEHEKAIYDFLREYTGNYPFLVSLREWVESGKALTEKQYIAAEKCWKRDQEFAAKKAASPAKKKLEEDGIYFKNGVVYKVVHAKNGSNKPYAKTLDNKYGTWAYAGQGPLWDLTEDDRMTLEDAKQFGKLYGICCNCGATLTDENSIEDGIGPICKKKFQ
jgi:hypothetical protein